MPSRDIVEAFAQRLEAVKLVILWAPALGHLLDQELIPVTLA